jgi:hypothetical protein
VVTAAGELDLAVTAQLADGLRRHPPALICDMSAIRFCAARVIDPDRHCR